MSSHENNFNPYPKDSVEIFGTTDKIPFSLVGHLYYLPKRTNQLPLKFDVEKSVGKIHTNTLQNVIIVNPGPS